MPFTFLQAKKAKGIIFILTFKMLILNKKKTAFHVVFYAFHDIFFLNA